MRILLVVSVVALSACGPKVGPPSSLVVEKSEALVARGAYLARHVTVCIDCHSTRDWTRFSAPLVRGTEGKGGEKYAAEQGFPGTFYSPNITPYALSSWTDGEVERAITAGVSKDGRALFPLMPYRAYGKLCQEDVNAIIAYIRTLPAVAGEVPKPQWKFPFSLIINNIPVEQPRPPCIDRVKDPAGYGRYLLNAAACIDCHTKTERGTPVPGMELAGGVTFQLAGGTLRSANITPDVDTGIGAWTREMFIARFKSHLQGEEPRLQPGDMQSIMPWSMYAGMTEEDLGALYDHLRTIPAVKHAVVRWEPREP